MAASITKQRCLEKRSEITYTIKSFSDCFFWALYSILTEDTWGDLAVEIREIKLKFDIDEIINFIDDSWDLVLEDINVPCYSIDAREKTIREFKRLITE